jgi:hypothetical protein
MYFLVPFNFVQAVPFVLVHLIDVNKLDLIFGFFRDTTDDINGGQPDKILELNVWLATLKGNTYQSTPIGSIFHVSRCGSTLLCQNLKASKQFVVLGEPGFLGAIYKEDSIISEKLRSVVAKETLNLWNLWACQQKKQLIIKFTSGTIYYLQKIKQDFPQLKVLFLYREPSAVIESLTRKPTSYIKHPIWRDKLVTLPKELVDHHHEYTSEASRIYLSSLAVMKAHFCQQSFLCEYNDLANNFSDIVNFFKPSEVQEDLHSQWQQTWSSKKGQWKSQKYKPVKSETFAAFVQSNYQLINYLLKEYQEFNEAMLTTRTEID